MVNNCVFVVLLVHVFVTSGQQANDRLLVSRSDQVQCRIELILPSRNLIEEFSLTYDRTLNLAKYEYSLDPNVPPYFSVSLKRTVVDYNTGTYYDMDVQANTCAIKFDSQISGNMLTTHSLLKMLSPAQLFSGFSDMQLLRQDKHRGIDTDVWTVDMPDYFLAGYSGGLATTRHTVHTLASSATKYFNGINQAGAVLHRSISLVNAAAAAGNTSSPPLVVLNYFDLYAPPTPQIYDFGVKPCLTASGADTQEEVLIKFAGKLDAQNLRSVANFRRSAWKSLSVVAGISPLRSLGNLYSEDDWSIHLATVILPRINRTSYFGKVDRDRTVHFLGYGQRDDPARRNTEMGFDSMVQNCAEMCLKDAGCTGFAWCPDGGSFQMFACMLQPVAAAMGTTEKNVLTGCTVYQDKGAPKTSEPDTLDVLTNLGSAIAENRLLVTFGNRTIKATGLRKNVAFLQASKEEKPHEEFALFEIKTGIVGKAAKLTVNKLNSRRCLDRCRNERDFICHSVSTCGDGDCVLSDLHGDELRADSTKTAMSYHSHCVTYIRVWTSDYLRVLPQVFEELTAFELGSYSQETCAKKCSFSTNAKGCESLVWCSADADSEASCQLFEHHAFALPAANTTTTQRNYAKDFQPRYGLSLSIDDKLPYEVDTGNAQFKCAKKCLDELGDEKCHAAEVCFRQSDGATSVRCRPSSLFVPSDRRMRSNNTWSNADCITLARTKYVDGSAVSARTAPGLASVKLGPKCSADVAFCLSNSGYSGGEMAAMGLSMLFFGCTIVLVVFVVLKKLIPRKEIPFVRFSTGSA